MIYPIRHQHIRRWLYVIIANMKWLVMKSQTAAPRFWMGISSIFCAFQFGLSQHTVQPDVGHVIMLQLASPIVWVCCFTAHGAAVWYGVLTKVYNKFLLLIEGVMGAAIWIGAAASYTIGHGVPNPWIGGALAAFWLLIRYPTHWEINNDPSSGV